MTPRTKSDSLRPPDGTTSQDHGSGERAMLEAQVLAEIGRVVTSTPDFESVFEPLAAQVQRILTFDRMSVVMLDEAKENMSVTYVSGVTIEGVDQGPKKSIRDSIARTALEKKQAVSYSRDYIVEHEIPVDDSIANPPEGLNSVLIAPLIWQDTAIGAIFFRRRNHSAYPQSDIDIATRIAAQISGVIENARLLKQMSRQSSEDAILANLSRIINESATIEDAYEPFIERLQDLIQFDRSAISIVDLENQTFVDEHVSGAEIPGWRQGQAHPLSGSVTELVIKNGTTAMVGAENEDEIFDPRPTVHLSHVEELQSLISTPLMWQGSPVGAIHLRSRKSNAYSSGDVQILERVSVQIAGAIATSLLHAKTVAEASRRALLADISRTVGSSVGIDAIAATFMDQLGNILPFDRLSIAVIDAENQTVTTIWNNIEALHPDYEVNKKRKLSDPYLARALKSRSVVTVHTGPASRSEDMTKVLDEGIVRLLDDDRERTALLAPMWLSEEPIGYLYLRSLGRITYSPEQVSLMEEIAAQIAPIVQNARSQQKAVEEADRRSALAEISRIFSTGDNLEAIYEQFVQVVQTIIPFDRMVVSQLNTDEDWVLDEFVWGAPSETVLPGERNVLSETPAILVVDEKIPLIQNEEEMSANISRFPVAPDPVKRGLRSALIAPIIWRGGLLARSTSGRSRMGHTLAITLRSLNRLLTRSQER